MKVAVLICSSLSLAGCAGTSDSCANKPQQSATSPDGAHQAVLFQRDCGATTGFTTQVSVVRAGEAAQGKGNVLITDHAEKAAAWGGPWAEVKWVEPRHLLVKFDRTARVFEKESSVKGVRVSFESVSR
jgi:hypothetical protein